MTKQAIKELPHDLTSVLPRGAIKEISQTTGMDRNSIRMILQGVWNNERVIKVALEILQRQKASIEETIHSLTHEISC